MTQTQKAPNSTLGARLSDGALVGHWTLDSGRSSAALRSRSMWGLVPVKGVFHKIDGEGEVRGDGTVSGHISISTSSIDTKNKKRDTHLRSAEFFASGQHPAITFELIGLAVSADGARASGTLIVRGKSRPLSLPVTVEAARSDEVILDAKVEVDRSDFGMTWNQMGMASMKNTVTVHATFIKD